METGINHAKKKKKFSTNKILSAKIPPKVIIEACMQLIVNINTCMHVAMTNRVFIISLQISITTSIPILHWSVRNHQSCTSTHRI